MSCPLKYPFFHNTCLLVVSYSLRQTVSEEWEEETRTYFLWNPPRQFPSVLAVAPRADAELLSAMMRLVSEAQVAAHQIHQEQLHYYHLRYWHFAS